MSERIRFGDELEAALERASHADQAWGESGLLLPSRLQLPPPLTRLLPLPPPLRRILPPRSPLRLPRPSLLRRPPSRPPCRQRLLEKKEKCFCCLCFL